MDVLLSLIALDRFDRALLRLFLLLDLLGLLFSLLLGLLLLHGLLLLLRLRLLLSGLGLRLLLLLLDLGDLLRVVVIVAAADQSQAGRADAGSGRCAQQRAPRQPLMRHALPIVACGHLSSPRSAGTPRRRLLRMVGNFAPPYQSSR